MRPKTQRRTQYTYRTYTQQDFEDFFRRAAGESVRRALSKTFIRKLWESLCDIYGRFDKILYGIGVAKGANKEEVKKAYLKKVKEHHPDRFANASEGERNIMRSN